MSTVAQRVADLQVAKEFNDQRADFCKVIKYFMLGKGPAAAADLALRDRAGERVISAIKSTVDPLSLANVGGQLSPFQLLSQAFLGSLSTASVFDAMLGSMLRMPMRSKVVAVTATITGSKLSESDLKRVGSLSLNSSDLDIQKAGALVAVTRETLVGGGTGVLQYLERELRSSVALATDSAFLAAITIGATSFPSSGANANGARQDLRNLLQLVTTGSTSILWLIAHSSITKAWASFGDTGGLQVFPNARWNGGEIAGVTILPSDASPQGQIILVDSTAVAANQDELRVDGSAVASIQMDSSPDSPPTASTNITSLWQANMTAVLVERLFAAKLLRTSGVAVCTSVGYTGGSPA